MQVQEGMLATTNLTSTYQARTVCKQNERDTVVPWLTLFHISWVRASAWVIVFSAVVLGKILCSCNTSSHTEVGSDARKLSVKYDGQAL